MSNRKLIHNPSLVPRLALVLALGGVLGGVLGGCATTPQVLVDMDRSVDFGQYKSFAFVSPLSTDRNGFQTLMSGHLKAAALRELEARGLRYDPAAPQLLVNFNANISERLRVSPGPSYGMGYGRGYGMGYYGYRGGLYSPWPYYQDMNYVSQYTEGTVNIDIVDASRKQMVWEGVVTGAVADNPSPEQIEAGVSRAMTAAFVKFPRAPLVATAAASAPATP